MSILRVKWVKVFLLARRELRDQIRDWRIILPLLLLTLLFPFLMQVATSAAISYVSRYGATLIADRLAPFFVMVVGFFPMTISLVIALESFVGEKELGTIEPLLSSPLEDWQMYMGKFLASTIIPLLSSYLGIGLYLLLLWNQGTKLPDLGVTLILILLTTIQGVLMVSGAVAISTQATSVRSANLMASFIIVPAALLIQGEAGLVFYGNDSLLFSAVFAVLIMAVLLIRLGMAHFNREALLGREIDVLNLRWLWRTFWDAFRGEATSAGAWIKHELKKTLRRLLPAMIAIVCIGVLASGLAYFWIAGYASSVAVNTERTDLGVVVREYIQLPLDFQLDFFYILGNNMRAVVFISLLGFFSFGVLGILLFIVNIGLIGAVLAIMSALGFSPLTLLLTAVLPHGVFEIIALILSGSAVLYLGKLLVTPTSDRTLGEVVISGIAEWTRIHLGLVFPLLILAAAVEAWLTPLIVNTANL